MAGTVFTLDEAAKKLARLGNDPRPVVGEPPLAAVAAILREGPKETGAELFFIRRAASPTDPWSGHIAFPGGRAEKEDASLIATAIRETREEVAIDLSEAEVVCRLPDVPAVIRTKRGRMVVTPFVFAIRHEVTPIPNEAEVAGTLWVPLDRLIRGEGRGTYSYSHGDQKLELPCVRLEPDEHVLWGMTHRMMETMVEALTA